MQIYGSCNWYGATSLNPIERANLDADFVDALAELYPTCEAFYFQNCGKLWLAKDVRTHQSEGVERFLRFGVNVRFFNIQGTNDMLIDTVGMNTLLLNDLQYHFHDIDPNLIVNHAYSLVLYILQNGKTIEKNDKIVCSIDDNGTEDIQCKWRYEDALIQPKRVVLDINLGKYASGNRK